VSHTCSRRPAEDARLFVRSGGDLRGSTDRIEDSTQSWAATSRPFRPVHALCGLNAILHALHVFGSEFMFWVVNSRIIGRFPHPCHLERSEAPAEQVERPLTRKQHKLGVKAFLPQALLSPQPTGRKVSNEEPPSAPTTPRIAHPNVVYPAASPPSVPTHGDEEELGGGRRAFLASLVASPALVILSEVRRQPNKPKDPLPASSTNSA